MSELIVQVFESGECGNERTVMKNGEVLFFGEGVGVSRSPRKAVRVHVSHGTKRSVGGQAGGNCIPLAVRMTASTWFRKSYAPISIYCIYFQYHSSLRSRVFVQKSV